VLTRLGVTNRLLSYYYLQDEQRFDDEIAHYVETGLFQAKRKSKPRVRFDESHHIKRRIQIANRGLGTDFEPF